jgi:amidase
MGGVVEGALTRSVRDTAAILDAIAGYQPGDPYVAPPPARPWSAEVGADPGQLRVGVLDHPPTPDVDAHADCAQAVAVAARLLESLGHAVEPAHPAAMGDPDFQAQFVNIVAAANAADFDDWERLLGRPLGPDELEPGNVILREMGRAMSAPQYLASVGWLYGYTRRMDSWWSDGGFDLLVTPVIAAPPPPLGFLTHPEQGMERVLGLLQYTAQLNATGQPAISLPLHWNAEGLPIGVQLVAEYGREDVLIRVASQLEEAQPWADRLPPVYAG